MLKKLIRKIATIFFRGLAPFLRCRISLGKNAMCFRLGISSSSRSNRIECDGWMQETGILFSGNENLIRNQGKIFRSRIVFEGEGNELLIAPGASLAGVTIFLRGNNCRIEVGQQSEMGKTYLVCQGQNNRIVIGSECLFSDEIDIWASDTHQILSADGTVQNHSRPVEIGNHVWLGKKVSILKGSSIGDGSIVGLGSLITGQVPPRVLVAGNPWRIIRRDIFWDKKFVDFG